MVPRRAQIVSVATIPVGRGAIAQIAFLASSLELPQLAIAATEDALMAYENLMMVSSASITLKAKAIGKMSELYRW